MRSIWCHKKCHTKCAEINRLTRFFIGGTVQITREAIFEANRNNQAATCVFLAECWLAEHPDDVGVIFDYAEMLYKLTRYEEAIQIYQDAIERFPDHRWGLFNQLGQLSRYRGDFATAETWFQQAIYEDNEEAASYIFLGAVQARQGKLREAEATHRRATQCSDGFVDEAYHNLGLVLRAQGRFEEARKCFLKAIEIDNEYEDAREALKDVESVIQAIKKAKTVAE